MRRVWEGSEVRGWVGRRRGIASRSSFAFTLRDTLNRSPGDVWGASPKFLSRDRQRGREGVRRSSSRTRSPSYARKETRRRRGAAPFASSTRACVRPSLPIKLHTSASDARPRLQASHRPSFSPFPCSRHTTTLQEAPLPHPLTRVTLPAVQRMHASDRNSTTVPPPSSSRPPLLLSDEGDPV